MNVFPKDKKTRHNIMYKTLGLRWLFEVFYPALAFATADRDEARNPQRFINVSVTANLKKTTSDKWIQL